MKGFISFVGHLLTMRKRSDREYLSHHNKGKKQTNLRIIGKTIATDSYPSTIDGYWFIVSPSTILNAFDFVTVNNLYESKTIGLVQDIRALPVNIASDSPLRHGRSDNIIQKYGTAVHKNLIHADKQEGIVASVAVIGNTGAKSESGKQKTINLPILAGKKVRFSTKNEILFALGVPKMATPIPSGIIEMSNGLQVPISLDITYLAGPDTAHMNVTGISGNKKTSYTLFLLQSLYQNIRHMDNPMNGNANSISAIIFNTKADDLLRLDHKAKHIENDTKKAFRSLGLELQGFENVTYFLPRGSDGMPNSLHIPDHFKTYSFGLKDIYDRLDLLFSSSLELADFIPVFDYIHDNWPLKVKHKTAISNWTELTRFKRYPKSLSHNRTVLQEFISHIQRFRKSPLFVDKKSKSTYLGDEIKKIKENEVFVIDVSAISSLEEQAFVIGDVFKSLNELYSVGSLNRYETTSFTDSEKLNLNRNHNLNDQSTPEYIPKKREIPKYLIVFLDEVNRFIPKSTTASRLNPVADQIMRFIIEGRSRCNILLSAQQFKSETDVRFQENIGLHVFGKLGISELFAEPYYTMISDGVKKNITRLERGEMIIVHPAFRHPVKVWFPDSPYQRP
jgi:hypothetical protein